MDAGSVVGEGLDEGQPAWMNALVGRIFWDFLREKYWTDQVAHKIQKKLSKIKVRVHFSFQLKPLENVSCFFMFTLPATLSSCFRSKLLV